MPYNLNDAGSTDPSHLAPNALVEENKQLRLAIVGLVEAAKGTLEWHEHHPHCPGGGECHCAHDELHAAVKAADTGGKS